jgi:hypothetical protein
MCVTCVSILGTVGDNESSICTAKSSHNVTIVSHSLHDDFFVSPTILLSISMILKQRDKLMFFH